MIEEKSTRFPALDIIRVYAITLVIYQHISYILPNSGIFYLLNILLKPDGVSIFFVLSGFLVGRIVLQEMSNPNMNTKTVVNVLQRRWLKTLPSYYLILLINIVLVHNHVVPGIINGNVLAYFAFFQNLIKPLDLFFVESWSLCVEEWFYLLLPIMLFLIIKTGILKIKNGFLILIGIFLLIAFTNRLIFSEQIDNYIEYDLLIRKMVGTRFDSIAIGLLIAWLYTFNKINLHKTIRFTLFLAGLSGIILLGYWKYENTLVYEMSYCTLESMLIGLMFPFLINIFTKTPGSKVFKFLSNITYQMYLQHMIFLFLLKPHFTHYNPIIIATIYFLLVVISSSFTYYIFEKPVMRLRESITKKITS